MATSYSDKSTLNGDLESQGASAPDLGGDLEESKAIKQVASASGPVEKPGVPTAFAADDPDNPKNMPAWKKYLVSIVSCSMVLVLTYSSSAYTGSIGGITKEFDTTLEISLLGLSLFLIGFGVGPIFWAPMSEVVGRKPVYVITFFISIPFSIGVGAAKNIETVLLCRLFGGVFGSAAISNAGASVSDVTSLVELTRYLIFFGLCAFAGPALGPLVGNYVGVYHWRWNFYIIAIVSGVVLIAVILLLPETHAPTLLEKKYSTTKRSYATKFQQLMKAYSLASTRPFIMLGTETIVFLVSLYLSVLYGILYLFFEAFPIVFEQKRGFTPQHTGITFLSLGLGLLCGAGIVYRQQNAYYERRTAEAIANGKTRTVPEDRLKIATYGAFLIPIGLFWFAWTAPFPHIHWIVPMLAMIPFGIGTFTIFSGGLSYLVDAYLIHAASALAASTFARSLFGFAFPLFATQMYTKLTVQGATSLLAGLTLLCVPIPLLFFKYGETLRKNSKYAFAT